jgi:hypothetical protein
MPFSLKMRPYLVYWLYAVAVAHFIAAILMTWFIDMPWLTEYHKTVLTSFGFSLNDSNAANLHQWWMSLFGATLQSFSLFMLALIYLGNRHRSVMAWTCLVATILLWAPQDIIISMQQQIWSHVWVDSIATAALVLPLIGLVVMDWESK